MQVFKCKYIDCSYTTDRKDNFDRHEKSHTNEKVACECGVVLTPGALDRHKKNACVLTIKSSVKMLAEFEDTTIAKVQTTVQMSTREDGSMKIQHGPIQINGVTFYLVPEKAIASNNQGEKEEEKLNETVDSNQSNDEGLGELEEIFSLPFEHIDENSTISQT